MLISMQSLFLHATLLDSISELSLGCLESVMHHGRWVANDKVMGGLPDV